MTVFYDNISSPDSLFSIQKPTIKVNYLKVIGLFTVCSPFSLNIAWCKFFHELSNIQYCSEKNHFICAVNTLFPQTRTLEA